MSSVVVTIQYQQLQMDMELPLEIPLAALSPHLWRETGWYKGSMQPMEKMATTGRVITSDNMIRPQDTLQAAGVVHGDVIELALNDTSEVEQIPSGDFTERASLRAYLQSMATGAVFPCTNTNNLIGRSLEVGINLAHLPQRDAVSRLHANILCREDGYWLKDENSRNGTFVNGQQLPPGERVHLRDGFILQFGKDGPVLTFRQP